MSLMSVTGSLLLGLACAPRKPPEGSVEISASLQEPVGEASATPTGPPAPLPIPVMTGAVPLPLGVGRPWEGAASTEAQRAFVRAEDALRLMGDGLEPVMSLDEALGYTQRAEEVRSLLSVSSLEAELRGPSAARLGDAQRLASSACRSAVEAGDLEEACGPLTDGASAAYELGLEQTGDQPQWHGHITWALQDLRATADPASP